jgi:hypothetical protein
MRGHAQTTLASRAPSAVQPPSPGAPLNGFGEGRLSKRSGINIRQQAVAPEIRGHLVHAPSQAGPAEEHRGVRELVMLCIQSLFDVGAQVERRNARRKVSDIAAAVDKELGKVPVNAADFSPSAQKLVDGMGLVAVDLDLSHLRAPVYM